MTLAVASYSSTAGTELTAPSSVKLMALGPPARITKKQSGDGSAAKLAEPPEDAHTNVVRIPVLVNHKPVEKGDVLMYHLEEKQGEKRDRAVELITVEQVMKSQKR